MMNVELGFDATNVLTLRLPIPNTRFDQPAQLTAYVRELMSRINGIPGVVGAVATDSLPLQGFSNGMPFLIAGREIVVGASIEAALDHLQVIARGLTRREASRLELASCHLLERRLRLGACRTASRSSGDCSTTG